MNYSVDHIDDLIGKYLAGEAAKEEILFVEAWANENEGNRKHLQQCKLIFDKSFQAKALQEFDTDAAWIKMKSRLQNGERTISFQPQKSSNIFNVESSCQHYRDFRNWIFRLSDDHR